MKPLSEWKLWQFTVAYIIAMTIVCAIVYAIERRVLDADPHKQDMDALLEDLLEQEQPWYYQDATRDDLF